MLNFKLLDINSREEIRQYLCKNSCIQQESCFSTIFMWSPFSKAKYCIEDDFLFILFEFSKNATFYLRPFGEGSLNIAFQKILSDSKERGIAPKISGASENYMERVSKEVTLPYSFAEYRNSFDYIYLREDLTELSGKKFHKKKNHVNKFKNTYEGRYSFEKLTLDVIDEVISFQNEWLTFSDKSPSIEDENIAILKALSHYEELELMGGVLRIDGKIEGYTFGSKFCDNCVDVQCEKANPSFSGIYQAINNFFVTEFCQDVTYINREDDFGIEGLRKAKLSYQPHMLLKKHIITLEDENG